MFLPHRFLLAVAATVAAFAVQTSPAHAAGAIDPRTVIAIPHGTFGGVKYVRYEAMFAGVTSDRHRYRVPCQIIAPQRPEDGCGLVVFDYLNTTAVEVGGTEAPLARYMMTDDFLFGGAASYATVRCDAITVGVPWSDGRLDTSTEFITSAGDEFAIAADYAKALRVDPVAAELLGEIDRMAAFGYSKSAGRVRGLLRLDIGEGL
ncbi:MAG TPA: hypothetical protein VKE74_06305, partial [Gemmataceae bacterium]|nr:hypothetical protein [Gemmataceae bacterium]